MTAPLPPFDLVSVCPKCGMMGGGPARVAPGTFVVLHGPDPFPVEYHPDTLAFGRFPCSLELNVEHLHRTCPQCGFSWAEACPSADDFLPIGPRPVPAPHVRQEVWAFALLMERELAEHDDREGWKHVKTEWLFSRLLEEVEEVRQVLIDLDRDAAGIQERAAERIGPEAADVANFCMFIADVCGALTKEAK